MGDAHNYAVLTGVTADAVEHWRQAVRADPNHSQALYNLSRTLDKMGDPDAQKYQDRFDALQKDQQITDRLQQLDNSALEAANAQNWSQAVEQMTEASRLCGTCHQSAHPHRNLVRSTGGLAGSRRLSRGNTPHSS